MTAERDRLTLASIGDDPLVGRWLGAMEDARRRTLRELADVTDAMVDARPLAELNTIGELLYHIGLIETDWLLSDILQLPGERWPPWIETAFPHDVRDDAGRLATVSSEPLRVHLDRLARVRQLLIDSLRTMSGADLVRLRSQPSYDVEPTWALHHLMQHEAEHRAQIMLVRDLSRR